MRSIERRRFQWPSTNPNPVFKVTIFFDAEYLIKGYRYGHSYYGRQIGNRTQYFEWYQFEWPSVTFCLAANYRPISLLSVLQAPGASCTPEHFSHSQRFTQSKPGWFLERSKHLWPGCSPHHFHLKWIPAEPKDRRRLSGLNSSIWHCLAHWSSLQTE